MEDKALEELIRQRGKEAELRHELQELEKTFTTIGEKNNHIKRSSDQIHGLEDLNLNLKQMKNELARRESQYDELIASHLAKVSSSRRGSTVTAGSGSSASEKRRSDGEIHAVPSSGRIF